MLRGAAALADAERADGAGCSAHGGARHEAPGLLPEGLAVRGRTAEAVRVQVGRCHDEPTLDRAVSSRWLPASVALRISHGRTEQLSFPPAGRPHRLPPPSQLQPRPSQRTPVQPSGRPAHEHSQPSPPSHAQHIPAHQRTCERRTCRASALLPLESTSRAHSRWPGGARRSNKNIYAQIIDDSKGVVLCSASTKEKGMDAATANGAPCALTRHPRARTLPRTLALRRGAWAPPPPTAANPNT